MAGRSCSKCGKELIEGKRFCGGCGQAVPAVPVPEPAAAALSAGPVCAGCGRPLVPGKKFCGFCGAPAAAAPPVVEKSATDLFSEVAVPAAAPPATQIAQTAQPSATDLFSEVALPTPPSVCAVCGTVMSAGETSCRACSTYTQFMKVEAPAAAPPAAPAPVTIPFAAVPEPVPPAAPAPVAAFAPVTAPAPVTAEAPIWESKPVDRSAEVIVTGPVWSSVAAKSETGSVSSGAAKASELDSMLKTFDKSSDDWKYDWAPVPDPVPPPVAAGPAAAAAPPVPAQPAPKKSGAGMAIGIAAVLLLAAGGVWAWLTYAHRNVTPVAETIPSTGQATSQASAPDMSSPQTTAPASPAPEIPKPSPSTPVNAAPPLSGVPTPRSAQPAPTHSPVKAPASDFSSAQQAAVSPQPPPPQPAAVPAPPPMPTQARSGVLHYTGAPVPLNGQVVFDHLPASRLKYSYDSQAWVLTIKLNPDGSKRVTLTSKKPGMQTACDLGWEIVE